MKGLLWIVGMFLLLVVTFLLIWFMTADRIGDAEVWLPGSGIEYAGPDRDAVYAQWFI